MRAWKRIVVWWKRVGANEAGIVQRRGEASRDSAVKAKAVAVVESARDAKMRGGIGWGRASIFWEGKCEDSRVIKAANATKSVITISESDSSSHVDHNGPVLLIRIKPFLAEIPGRWLHLLFCDTRFTQPSLIWYPPNPAFASVEIFRRMINRKREDYSDLHQYSVNDYNFYLDMWEQLGVVVEPGKTLFQLSWFPGARLNYAENLLQHNGDGTACSAITENHVVRDYSYRQLRSMVADMAAAMRVNGLAVGDRVAGNSPVLLFRGFEFHYCNNSGASSNKYRGYLHKYGTRYGSKGLHHSRDPNLFAFDTDCANHQGILDRYRQIQPKFVFMETELFYAGRGINVRDKAKEVIESLNQVGLELGILLPSRISGQTCTPLNVANSISLEAFLSSGDKRPLAFEQLPFQHPLVILYSSGSYLVPYAAVNIIEKPGTTGMPKCIVHSAGGILLQIKKELTFVYNVGPQDTFFQFTTTGWMMWMLLIGGLSVGARIILYDGSPSHPSIQDFLHMINDLNVSVLGLSPRFLAEVQGRNPELKLVLIIARIASFEALHTLALGGAIVTSPVHRWAQKTAFPNARVFIGMGATDVCSAFLVSLPSLPMYAGEISAYALGYKMEVFDESGKSITETGEIGEMVCTRPHPSVPLFFWGDDSGEKFRQTYFDHFPGVWRQGDLMSVNPKTGGIMVLGRSDAVLNRKGIRLGTSEIYSVLEDNPRIRAAVEESICVGQRRPQDDDERILLFVKMRPGKTFSPRLVESIKATIRKGLSSRHVPDYVFQIESIPVTVNGKKIEVAVKQIVSGSETKPSGAVANPDSLAQFYKYRKIEDFQRSKSRL
ncbi:hypothetical protein D9757_000565 [Collybiopsis confluens]|uniref:AMP-dependent synthetase/ligase domain-containing protein n=1 Tax=Collybiopsis confluens TaxID=2823264 RepID=A0A8H5I1A2_9AGAR|nr:hypothetical protein D9757_000565 [Collybiopsis confluens]